MRRPDPPRHALQTASQARHQPFRRRPMRPSLRRHPDHRAHAEQVLLERAEASALADLHRIGVEPISNPLEALAELTAEARQWEAILRSQVADLESLSQMTPAGVEQVRTVVVLFERAMDRAAAFASMCAKLNIEDRIFRLQARINEESAGRSSAYSIAACAR